MVCSSTMYGAESKRGITVKHLGFYILTILFDENGDVGNAEIEDSGIFQDDTAVLHDGDAQYLNLYYHYNPNGWLDEKTNQECGKWKLIPSKAINELQSMWEEREAMWLEDDDFLGLSTLVKLTDTCGNPLEKDDMIDEIEQGFKAINWYLYSHDYYTVDYDRVMEEELPPQIEEITNDIKKYKLMENGDAEYSKVVAEMYDRVH